MRNEKILLSSPHMSEEGYEKKFVQDAFDTNWIAPLGKNVNKFEEEIANYVGVDHVVALNSGTAAIHLALIHSGVRAGDVVICQSLTFAASANPIIYQGATPVFVDSDYETWNMDPILLEQALKKYPQTKAVIVVNLYGMSAHLEKIRSLCDQYNVKMIEDAAESLGTFYKGVSTGTISDYGVFSFNGNKIITTSGGGALVVKDQETADKIKFWATQARDEAIHYQHSELGFNYRLSNVSAGIGRGQLKVLNKRVEKKNYIYNYYKEHLSHLNGISFMPENEFEKSNRWLSCILLEEGKSPTNLYEKLAANNIESRPIWKPMHLQPFYSHYDYFGKGVSDDLFKRGLCLPSDTKMTNDDLDRVIKCIEEYLDEVV